MFLPVIERIARLVSKLHPFLASFAQHFIRSNFFRARVPFEVGLAFRLPLDPSRCLGCRLNDRCDVVIGFTTIRNSLFFIARLRSHPSQGTSEIIQEITSQRHTACLSEKFCGIRGGERAMDASRKPELGSETPIGHIQCRERDGAPLHDSQVGYGRIGASPPRSYDDSLTTL